MGLINPNGKIIGIVGTRRRYSAETFDKIVEKFSEVYEEGDWIVSGGCPQGGDRFAEMIAKQWGVPILIFYPNWKKYGNPKAAFIRNSFVAFHSDILIASVAEDRTGGTEDTITKWCYYNTKPEMDYNDPNVKNPRENLIIV